MNNEKQLAKDKDSEVWEQLGIILAIVVVGILVLPPFIMAILIFLISRPFCIKRTYISKILSTTGVILAVIFFSSFPYQEYFGYLRYVPFDVAQWKTFSITYKSILFYVALGLTFVFPLEKVVEYYRSKIVRSKEVEQDEKRSTKKYQKTEANRLEITNKLQKKWREKPLQKDKAVFLGIDEFGEPYYMGDKELNTHALLVSTTGGGKTTLCYTLVEGALRKNKPFIFVDGKGDPKTIEEIQSICDRYGVKLHVFSDKLDLSYNVIKYGNKTAVKDKLMNILEWSEQYYANKSKNLLQNIVAFIDDYGFPRDLRTVAKFLNAKRIMEVLEKDVVTTYVEVKTEILEPEEEIEEEPEMVEENKEESTEASNLNSFDINNFDINNLNIQNVKSIDEKLEKEIDEKTKNLEHVKVEKVKKKPSYKVEKIPKEEPTERAKKYKEVFFERMPNGAAFEGIEGLQTQIYTLLDSEIGHLFEESEDGLDLYKVTEAKEAILFSLDGNIYKEFINIMARLVILDVQTLVSMRGRRDSVEDGLLAIYDEFSAYGNPDIVDNINKSRSAGVECIIGTQTLADIEKVEKGLVDQIIGNTNTYFFGLANDDYTVEKMANTLGTYEDNDVTYQTEKVGGTMKRIDMKSEKGTVRSVQKYQVRPQTLREFKIGQFAVWRKASNERLGADIVYMRNALKGVETDGKEQRSTKRTLLQKN
ncbi:TraM recognition domain-containing protein [Bacillus thuringiensis]|uniref:TraD/TraG TraM recognition site domain-containing protein n=1 Tax=Bacillus thuringiensis subsp. jegathesan TaxID=56955 RepID=A0A9X6MR78_BACTJ|nr:TraM recognition domain-containing protein [Bacillus thuringiensis]OUB78440.1 hypothetical protein BK750_00180 [Bacillus thuringiensis serovar jegathesan]